MVTIHRVQCGVRLDKRMLKVAKALAEYLDVSLAELLELMILSAFEGAPAFSKGTLKRIAELARIYELARTAADATHVLYVRDPDRRAVSGAGRRRPRAAR